MITFARSIVSEGKETSLILKVSSDREEIVYFLSDMG